MATKEPKVKGTKQYQIISLRRLCKVAKFDYFKLYNTITGIYTSPLSANEKTVLCNGLRSEIEKFFDFLGFEIIIKRKV